MANSEFALKVVRDDENQAKFRWAIIEDDEAARGRHHVHQLSDCAFDAWGDALNAGTIALAKAAGQPYENEAADPVGDADRAAPTAVTPGAATSSNPYSAYVSRDNLRRDARGEAAGLRPAQTSNRYGSPQGGKK